MAGWPPRNGKCKITTHTLPHPGRWGVMVQVADFLRMPQHQSRGRKQSRGRDWFAHDQLKEEILAGEYLAGWENDSREVSIHEEIFRFGVERGKL